ncbi:MAG TPA: acyl-ACP thioesterase domain-containing protein, partial [Acidimicrobiales bacterium]|nr:acyl-ACP thioesterase domain-containing protein [Acidimicrobiales bacterium]
MLDEPLAPLPEKGRVFRTERRVRLADAGPSERMRFDAFARFLQDIGNDDTADSGLDDLGGGVWVVRRAVVDVLVPPRWGEWLELATWCAGTGGRWAERRLTIRGEDGGHVETSTLWVHLHPETLAPARLPDAFLEIYGEAAGGRRVSASHWLYAPAGWRTGTITGERVAWPLRAVDYDVMRHVNNAAYWAAVEEMLAATPGQGPHPRRGQPVRAILEYGPGIAPGSAVDLLVQREPTQLDIWFTVQDTIAATAHL